MSSATRRPPLTYIFSPFSDVERDILERFARKVAALEESEFPGSDLNIIATPASGPAPGGGPGWSFSIDGPDEREVKAVVGDFRQIYTDSARTSARRVLKMLRQHAYERKTDPSRAMIDQLRSFGKELGRRKKSDPRGYVLEEGPNGETIKRSPDSIVREWFNSVYFHDEPGLGRELENDGAATVEMFRWNFQTVIKDFIRYWGKLRVLVEAVLRDPSLRS